MARESQTIVSPWRRTGTRPLGVHARIRALVSACLRGITTSSKAAPVCFRASQPRSDQEE